VADRGGRRLAGIGIGMWTVIGTIGGAAGVAGAIVMHETASSSE
jgi:hypothetical protein